MNTITEIDAYPMPRVDELIDRLGSSRLLTLHMDIGRCRLQREISTKLLLQPHMDSFRSGLCRLVSAELRQHFNA